jgi:hypothetical protein
LNDVELLKFGEVEVDVYQLYTQDLGGLPGFVGVGGYEEGFHATESTTRTPFVVESPICAR